MRSMQVAGVVALLVAAPALTQGGEEVSTRPATLAEVGMQLEQVPLRAPAEREAALADVEQALSQAQRGGLSGDRRLAAQLLAGEVQYGRHDYARASQYFGEAEKSGGVFADDAGMARIQALEAKGQDAEAAKEWAKWEKRYPQSSLLPEVRLARTWNAIRRMALEEAARTLAELVKQRPHLQKDPRVVLADATLHYLNQRYNEALAALGTQSGAGPTYLRALCQAALGARLKAAAHYQEVVDRYPESPLREHAMLAKANSFLESKAFRSAAEEFRRVAERVQTPDLRAEAELRRAGALVLDGDTATGSSELQGVVAKYPGTGFAARAQYLLGEVAYSQQQYEPAIVEYNRLLTTYFEHALAATAQYRVGRCLDALNRKAEATSAYQAVVRGYPLEAESPAAAYLAGVGLMEQGKPLIAAPYFQLVLDRYAQRPKDAAVLVFASPEHQELVEAALCLLELCYHKAGDLGQLSGAPHMTLQQMPPSRSSWRAYALLIDADALAAMGRHDEAQGTLSKLVQEFPDHAVALHANRLLAWTYAQQGKDALAIETEQRMLVRYAATGNADFLGSAYLNKAHVLFNSKKYAEAAAAYDDYLKRFAGHSGRQLALYQAGVAYTRLDRNGDAVDRWEMLVKEAPKSEIAERAWARVGDLYFRAEHYADAKRCYQGLLENFAESQAAALAHLRLAQCDYNAGRDGEALQEFSEVGQRYPGTVMAKEAARGSELALYRLGQDKGGIATLAQLVEQYPTSSFAADAQFRIAMHHYEAKRWAEAIEGFRRVVTQFPGFTAADQAHFLMADAAEQNQQTDEARRGYDQFLMFFPESELRPTAQFRLGMLDFQAGDHMRAAVQFTGVLDSEKANAETRTACLYNLALCQRVLGDTEAARTSLERYRTEHPGDPRSIDVAYQLGDLHEKAGHCGQALEEYQKALAGGPPAKLAVELYYRMGACREQEGQADAAVASYQKAMQASDKSDAFRLSAVVRLATLHEEKGNFKGALAAYRDLVRNAKDAEMVAAAKERVAQLEAAVP
ncbi:MAG TPA: tetratricopeptide repeat protein [Candidatus Krumholzibacteria bacterium]|nr:tetratricopeptide repeat protein [Candidatus Krumholzibacteria bacterium]